VERDILRGEAVTDNNEVETKTAGIPDSVAALKFLLESNDFDVRNLRSTIRAGMVEGSDCFDLRGTAKVLAAYAKFATQQPDASKLAETDDGVYALEQTLEFAAEARELAVKHGNSSLAEGFARVTRILSGGQ
jgi:hypothetical protein